jgi:DNA repair photolyase
MPGPYEYPDAIPQGQVRGRGAGLNPGNRYEEIRLHVLGEHLDEILTDPDTTPRQTQTRVYKDHTRTILNHVDSPDIGFNWSINPYRGCEHGCIYCYARPFHEQLGFSCGLDFETRIMAKLDAPRLLRKELAKPSWRPETIAMSGVTDCYQPIEAKLRLTRGCLEVFAECRQPVAIVTKNRLILRDLDLLQELTRFHAVSVAISLTSLKNDLARTMEPRASSPADRLHVISALSAAGIPVTVMTAPIIPGLNDQEIPSLLQAAADHGARSAAYVLLRLPYQIKALFLDWLKTHYPQRADRVESLIRQTRDGHLYQPTFGLRMVGHGAIAGQIHDVFHVFG